MKITTIIFDLGNVVLTNDWHDDCQEKFSEFAAFYEITADDMERGWQAAWPQFQIGKCTEREFWTQFLKTAGAKNLDPEQAITIWRKYQRANVEMLKLIATLKQRYRIAALANTGKEWLEYKIAQYELGKYFSNIVGSGHVGVEKPQQGIYRTVMEELQVIPTECLFIDDQEQNLAVAKVLGMQTIRFHDQCSLEKELRALGITF